MGWFDRKESTVTVEIREIETVREVVREVPVPSEKVTMYQVVRPLHFGYMEQDKDILWSYWPTCEEAFAAVARARDGGLGLSVSAVDSVKVGGEYFTLGNQVRLGKKPDPKKAKRAT